MYDSSIRITAGRGVTWKGRAIYERHGVRAPRSRVATLVMAFLFFTTPFQISIVNGQKRTREEALKEAGSIAVAAERKIGEANKTGDRKLIMEAERAATESFVNAIALWREAGDDTRLIAAVEELTRLYSVLGEYDKTVKRLEFEANYWLHRGDVKQQLQTLFVLGTRQSQMNRDAAAIETLQQVIDMSRGPGLYSVERNALEQLALVYTRVGRKNDAEAARAKAKELWARKEPALASPPGKPEPITVPAQWIDLPSAPMAAEYRDVDGVNQAVLVNRSSKVIQGMTFGCVVVEVNNKARVLYDLMGLAMFHGGVSPGSYHQPFATLNGPLSRWSDEKMGCEGAGKMTLIEVVFEDRTGWKAEGADSVVR